MKKKTVVIKTPVKLNIAQPNRGRDGTEKLGMGTQSLNNSTERQPSVEREYHTGAGTQMHLIEDHSQGMEIASGNSVPYEMQEIKEEQLTIHVIENNNEH